MKTERWMKTGMMAAMMGACTLADARPDEGHGGPGQEPGHAGHIEKGRKDASNDHRREAALKKYDKDGDGRLSDAELQTLKTDRAQAREKGAREGRPEGERPSREEMTRRFDADGDGQLNEAERMALRKEMEVRRREHGGERPSREEMVRKFDADGDGQLSEAERAAAREAMGGRRGGPGQRQEMMKKVDTDGDGRISDEERAAAREAFEKKRAARESGDTD